MNLEVKIPKGNILVENPDHPFTYLGPNLLISSRNGLLAVFIPSKNESLNKLIFRLLNSRLAYPAHTIMAICLSEENYTFDVKQLEGQYFEKIIELKDLKKVKALISDKKSDHYQNQLKQVQKKVFKFQAQNHADNIKYISKSDFNKKEVEPFFPNITKLKYYSSLTQKEEISKLNIYSINDEIIGFKNLNKNKTDLIELSPFYEYSMKASFVFDTGVPFFHKTEEKILSLNEIPLSRFDPMKPIRIASLFGWLIGNINTEEDFEKRKPKKNK